MFTFKKFAAVGVAAFAAFSISCSEDETDEPEPLKTFSFDEEKSVELGGSGASTGSSLDIDNFAIYTSTTVAANAANVDLVFSGTVIYTPAGAVANSYLSTSLAGGVGNGAYFFEVPANTSTADDLVDAYQASTDELSAITPANGGKFGVFTSDEGLALVIINDKGGTTQAQLLKIKVSRID